MIMSLKKSKDATGRVNTENISGAKVPRKGLSDETTGKAAGTRNVRKVGGPRFNFVRSGG
jgi:hypothetical protein